MKWNLGIAAAVCLSLAATAPPARAQVNANGAEVITNGPQTSPGDRSDSRAGAQNQRDSERYDSAVRGDPNYRATREQKECGSIDDMQMRAKCLATFGK